jgi:dihydroorotase
VRAAKTRGLPVTCEVTPHHLFLCEDDLDESYNTSLKMNPPLRTAADCTALQEALIDGTIDCLATDHAPHARHEKSLEFELAPFGTTGLETALGLMLTHMVAPGRLSWAGLVECMAHAPRRILKQEAVTLAAGSTADISITDLDCVWTVEAEGFESKSNNSAYIGHKLTGRARHVLVEGYATLKDAVVVDV